MGSEERKPSLQAPSLGLRRRKTGAAAGGQAADSEPLTVADAPPEPPVEPVEPVEPAATEPPGTVPGRLQLGPMNGHLAAALTGLVVAAFLVLSTFGGLQACQSIRGTTACGGGPGFLMLILIVVLAVVIGALLLRAAHVPSAGSISFLAVALVSVLSLLFLLDSLEETSGAVAVAVLTVAAYLLAHGVTARYIDPSESGP
jgi:hypothetical protein